MQQDSTVAVLGTRLHLAARAWLGNTKKALAKVPVGHARLADIKATPGKARAYPVGAEGLLPAEQTAAMTFSARLDSTVAVAAGEGPFQV